MLPIFLWQKLCMKVGFLFLTVRKCVNFPGPVVTCHFVEIREGLGQPAGLPVQEQPSLPLQRDLVPLLAVLWGQCLSCSDSVIISCLGGPWTSTTCFSLPSVTKPQSIPLPFKSLSSRSNASQTLLPPVLCAFPVLMSHALFHRVSAPHSVVLCPGAALLLWMN